MSFVGLLIAGIIFELLLPVCAKAAPGPVAPVEPSVFRAALPLRAVRGVHPAGPETFTLHAPPRWTRPESFLQRAWLKVANIRPDVTLQSVPGRGGIRIMLAVDTLSLFHR